MERKGLSDIFKTILGTTNEVPEKSRVYFQPPEKVQLIYPAILYEFARVRPAHADNLLYFLKTAYTVTLIDKNPDNTLWEAILNLPYCSFDRHFTADNLNHYIFTLFY